MNTTFIWRMYPLIFTTYCWATDNLNKIPNIIALNWPLTVDCFSRRCVRLCDIAARKNLGFRFPVRFCTGQDYARPKRLRNRRRYVSSGKNEMGKMRQQQSANAAASFWRDRKGSLNSCLVAWRKRTAQAHWYYVYIHI